ncbi:phytanoyl-CoA dioxygenase family protein [Rhodococcus sp. 06-235-1A]|uniref:phytanoyl-CoA dioxygenase family protein n=1 Tax=Rhodococcus sp. 06-235-1A TaxID=2022508 RepID=UPI0015C5E4C3|nr:phytanoyl-CoA dioxygenase family protein [Rhodococcus sp. 06-235-1A]
MKLTDAESHSYWRDGFVCKNKLFTSDEVAAMRAALATDAKISGPQRILEDGSDQMRALYASHHRQSLFANLVRTPRLLAPVQKLLNSDAYVYQFKTNVKSALSGGGFSWHQDFHAWQLEDGLPEARLVNIALFLDDVTEFNGPVVFAAGSHADQSDSRPKAGAQAQHRHLDPRSITLDRDELVELVGKYPLISPKGAAGSVVFFHPKVVHGSASNMSPHPRRLTIITYNDIRNLPKPNGAARPNYLVGDDTDALAIDHRPLLHATEGRQ